MDDTWLYAVGAVIVGVAAGLVGAALVRAGAVKGREDRPEVVEAARAVAIFFFLCMVALGVIVAIGVTNPNDLEPIPRRLVDDAPTVLLGGAIVIVGRALGYLAAGAVYRSMSRSSARLRERCASGVRVLVTAASVVLALRQMGLDTTVLDIVVAAVVFGAAAAFALLVGLGGRDLSREVSHGRYLARTLRIGDDLQVGAVRGVVVGLLPASVALRLDDGSVVHVPNTQVFGSAPRVRRTGAARAADAN